MLRAIAPFLFIIATGQAQAQSCPDFFRFVDFGLEARDGTLHRGGTILRAESFEGEPLLLREKTLCRAVQEVSKDGPGNPIPVVSSIDYDPAKTGIPLIELRILSVKDATAQAEENAAAHRAALDRPDTEITRGSNFLCAAQPEPGTLSCQLLSPYPGNAPLVVYCDALRCEMPGLAINTRLLARAAWTNASAGAGSAEAAGTDILSTLEQIHGFLTPLSSGL